MSVRDASASVATGPLSLARQVRLRTLTFAVITVLVWASAFAAIRVGLQAFSPVHVALLRYLIAALVLAVYALITHMPLPRREDIPRLALAGLVGFTLYNTLLNLGEVTVPSAVASFIIASAPVFMALLATFFLGERLRLFGWLGIALSFVGVSVIAFGSGTGLQIDPRAIVILLAALAQSLYSVGQKPLLTRYSPFQFTSYAIWFGVLFLLIFAPGLLDEVRAAPIGSLLALAYLGIFPGAIGYITWSYVLARTPASTAASILYMIPVLALFIAWIWLGEVPSVLALFGGVLIIMGVITVNVLGRRRKEPLIPSEV
jgi:drug/metabolite transporter (DMT)-like permease